MLAGQKVANLVLIRAVQTSTASRERKKRYALGRGLSYPSQNSVQTH